MGTKTTLLTTLTLSLSLAICINAAAEVSLGGGRFNSQPAHSEQVNENNVSGVVVADTGEPLAGVFIYVKGTNNGVQSDINGHYSIKAPAEGQSYVLVFQYLGMKTREFTIKNVRKLNVTLETDNELDSSVIVGAYGTKQRREDLVGSAFQVSGEALRDKPKTRLDNLLDGLVPGMSIEASADYAGSTRDRFNVRIRGEASLSASNDPLWIIDGVPSYTGGRTNQMPGMSYTISPLNFLDPNDIESITILKDADQTTIYGANGSNGVILVTTKRGSAGNLPLSVNATLNYGVSAPDMTTKFKLMNASQYLEVAKEAWVNSGNSISDFPYQDNDYNSYSTTDTDWVDQYLGLGSDLYATVSLSTGSKKVKSYVSGSYYRKENIVQSDLQQRFYLRMNEDFNLADNLRLGLSLTGTYNDNDLFMLGNEYLDCLPIFSPFLNDGYSYRLYNKIWDDTKKEFVMKKFFDNSIPEREENTNNQRSVKTIANFDLNWEIIKGLNFSAVYGFDYMHSHEDTYESRLTLGGLGENNEPVGYSGRKDASYVTWTNIERLNFNRTFGNHRIIALAGIELHEQRNKYLSASGSGFLNDNIQEITYAEDESIYATSNVDISRTMSTFVRGEYSWKSRYYIAGNYRRDGSSSFGRYKKWANFWSVGASWNIHKEDFFNSSLIKMLKLKASFGSVGNSRLDSSVGKGSYAYGDSYSYGGVMGATLSTVPNPGLSWETTYKTNVGFRIELGSFLEAELEYYHHKTVDLLSQIYVSRTITEDRVHANIGKIRNTGFELNIESTNIKTADFRWTTSLNMAHNDNKILELYEGIPTGFFDSVWMEGQDSNSWWLVEWAGVDPTDGSPLWYDKDGNLTKTFSYDNRRPGKSPSPICYGGMINAFQYKNWELSFQLNYTIGGYELPTYARRFMSDGHSITDGNQAIEVYYYRWTTPGQSAKFPKVYQASTNQSAMGSARYLYNKTNFNITHLSLSYNMPERWVSKIKMNSMRLAFTVDNVYIFTPDMSRKFNSYKTAKYGYPQTRTFTLGLNVSF